MVNKELYDVHVAALTHPAAKELYDKLCTACDQREGGITDTDQYLIKDAATAEEIKQACIADIAKRGLGQERNNGKQKYWAENKSVGMLKQWTEQQRKTLAELRLTPNSRKAENVTIDEEFTDF